MNTAADNAPRTQEGLSDYQRAWCDMMVDIWREQMSQLGIVDSGALYSSVAGLAGETEIQHEFLLYGIYVHRGTGREFTPGNGGNLDVMDGVYRDEHGLDKPRKRGPKWGGGYTSGEPRQEKPWFSRKYLYSIHRLQEVMAESYGAQAQDVIMMHLDAIFGKAGDVMK